MPCWTRTLAMTIAVFAPYGRAALAAPSPGATAAPEVFAPGVISGPANDADPAFSSDGKTVIFARQNALLIAHRTATGWSTPEIAPFSGQWRDQQPAMAPDGSFLVFVSNRPIHPGDKPPAGNIWRVDRTSAGWAEPVHLPEAVNRSASIWAPSIAGDGSLYFIEAERSGAPLRIRRSQLRAGRYEASVAVSFGDPTTQDVDPAVAPDESFIVFGSMHPGPDAHERLYIAFKQGGGWGPPIDLGSAVNRDGGDTNEARLGPDGRTLYFASDRMVPSAFPRSRRQAEDDLARMAAWNNGTLNIWSVSLAPWLDAHRGRG